MEERLDIRGTGLAAKTRRAGRRLPKWVHREMAALLEAMEFVDNPRLQPRIDMARVDTGTQRVEAWLKEIDPWDRRKGVVIHWLAGNALNLVIIFACMVAVMVWRGLL